jgi:hypothetical protein
MSERTRQIAAASEIMTLSQVVEYAQGAGRRDAVKRPRGADVARRRDIRGPVPPEFLYRYRPFQDENNSLRFLLREGMVYFGSPVGFDDVEDLRFPGALVVESQVRLMAAKLGKNEAETAAAVEEFRKDPSGAIYGITEAIQSILNRTGVLCLAETPTSREMWRLYANNGRGVCIRLRPSALEEWCRFGTGPFPGRFRGPWRVSYSDVPKQLWDPGADEQAH